MVCWSYPHLRSNLQSSPSINSEHNSSPFPMQAANNAAAKQDVKVTSPPADVAIVATSSVESDGVPPLPKHKITEVDFPETPAAQMLISKQSVRTDGAASGTVVSSSAVVISPGSGCPAGEGTVRKAIQMPALTPARYNFAHLSTLTSTPIYLHRISSSRIGKPSIYSYHSLKSVSPYTLHKYCINET